MCNITLIILNQSLINKNMKINNIKIKIKSISIFLFIFLLNLNLVFAQDNAYTASQSFKEVANNITNNVLTSASTLLMTAAFVIFFYGLAKFIYDRAQGKDGNELKKGKEFMMWGLISLFVMVSVWGIIKLAQGLLQIKGNEIVIEPVRFATLNTGSGGGTGSGEKKPEKNVLGNEDDFLNTKKTGETCVVQEGEKSQCVSGLYCLGPGGASLKKGEVGQCRPKNSPIQNDAGGVKRENVFDNKDLYPVIKIGAKSTLEAGASPDKKAFTLLENLLKKHNCMPSNYTFSTTYDEADAAFVKNFQKVNGLGVDGEVGKETWEALAVTTGQKTTFTGIVVKDCPN